MWGRNIIHCIYFFAPHIFLPLKCGAERQGANDKIMDKNMNSIAFIFLPYIFLPSNFMPYVFVPDVFVGL